MGVLDTTYTFTATDIVTSAKLNNVIDQTTFTSSAVIGATLAVTSGQLKVNSLGIGANELANDSVTTVKILDGNVTQAKTNNSLVPAGAIMPFAMNSAPIGWLATDGTAVSRSTYATLFAAIATTYGVGDGSTTFNVPDLRGYFVRGTGTNSDGTASGTFATKQADEFKSHNHNISVLGIVGGTNPGVTDAGQNSTQSYATTSTGGTETRPRNIALLYCIKY